MTEAGYRRERTGHGIVLVLLAGALCWLAGLYGCGAAPIERSTRAYGSLRAAHHGAVGVTRRHVADDLRTACAGADDYEACVTDRVERWRAVEAGLNSAATALDAAGDALLLWAEAGTEDPPDAVCPALAAALRAVTGTLDVLRDLGVRIPLPALPSLACEEE